MNSFLNIRSLSFWNIAIVAAITLSSCGKAEFNSSPSATKSSPKSEDEILNNEDAIPEVKKLKKIEWAFSCNHNQSDLPNKVSDADTLIKNQGPHLFESEKIDPSVSTLVNAKLCPAQGVKRDIILTIDVSSSMSSGLVFKTGNDPLINNSCGRLIAVNEVVKQSFAAKTNRVAIVTFSSGVVASSSTFHENEDTLYSELLVKTGMKNIHEVLCAGVSGTYYDEGLKASAKLFTDVARKDAIKELYFVSDGAPETGREGKSQAEAIRQSKVAIATVMLGKADDKVLSQDIASKDQSGKSLHARASDSAELVKIVSGMSANHIVGGFFSISELDKKTEVKRENLDLNQLKLGALQFDLPMDLNITPAGFSFKIEYWDRYDYRYTNEGVIKFQ